MILLFFIGFFAALIAAISHIILKLGADKKSKGNKMAFFLNPYTIFGYGLMFGSTLLNLYVFKHLELKYAFVFYPLTFIMVFLFSILLLKEQVTRKKILSYCLIILGIVVFNL